MALRFFKRFNELLVEGDQYKINCHFSGICWDKVTVEEIRYLVDNGANPRFNNDKPFVMCCRCNSVDVLLLFINEYGANINGQDGEALTMAVREKNYEAFKFLIESGITVSDKLIETVFRSNENKFIQIMIEFGVPVERIAKIYWKYLISEFDFVINKLNLFNKNGLDLNQSIGKFFAERKIE